MPISKTGESWELYYQAYFFSKNFSILVHLDIPILIIKADTLQLSSCLLHAKQVKVVIYTLSMLNASTHFNYRFSTPSYLIKVSFYVPITSANAMINFIRMGSVELRGMQSKWKWQNETFLSTKTNVIENNSELITT